MIRSAMGAFGAILGTTGGAASRTSGRLLAGRQFAVRRISTRIPQGPVPWHDRMAAGNMLRQLWMRRPVQKPMRALRVGHPRAPNGQPRRSFHSTKTRRAAEGAKDQGAVGHQSLSARLKKLSKEYGWAAVGIYLGLSVLDFPFCFLLVRTLGTERIAVAEEFVVSNVNKVVPERVKEMWREYRHAVKDVTKEVVGNDESGSQDAERHGWGVAEADARNKTEPSLATQLALAYAIHKSFIFLRVPLTAAVTPKVVKVLRSWGWQIGQRRPKRS